MAQQKQTQEQDINQLLKVRRDKLKELQENGKDPFVITKYDVTHHSQEIKDNYEELEEKEVSVAGRMMSKRVMGKASFCNVQDLKGNIQSYVARDSVGEENYKEFKKLDVGDVIGIEGEVFRTKTGEISIHASHVTLLSKSLQILPEKFHGLTNTDTRYRQRYVDLIMNPEVKDTFIKRSRIISAIRKYLDGEGFMEVETPMLVANAGGAAARPFETHFNALNEDLKLRISLELYLKRLIVGGLEKVYEIGRVFRNEGLDTRHNPEFTLMELYQAYTDYNGMMDLTENLYRHVAREVLGTTKIVYNGIEMDLGKPFERITMVDAVKKYAGIDWNEVETLEQARELAKEHNIEFEERHKKGDILNLFFEEYVEEHLVQPTFVMDHHIEISPLTKKKPENPDYVCLLYTSLEDGWLKTGDLGYVDEEGFVYLTGRKKNLIITKNGENVSPEELENALSTNRLVGEVLVRENNGVIEAEIYPDQDYVKKKRIKDVKAKLQEVIDEYNKTAAPQKKIYSLIVRDTEFEKTTTRKIKRF